MEAQRQGAPARSASEFSFYDRRPHRMLRGHKTRWGRQGERDVAAKVPCPECGHKLMSLPANYPVVDLVCNNCGLEVQVKTTGRPKNTIQGGGWEVMEKHLTRKNGVPPLIVNCRWGSEQVITLFRNIPENHLRQRTRGGRQVFEYVRLQRLESEVVYRAPVRPL